MKVKKRKILKKKLKSQIKTMKKEINELREAWNNEINLNAMSQYDDVLCPNCGEIF